jgi:two-component system LytT family sensor kinase
VKTSRLRRYAFYWAAWTGAGLFYFTQDFAPRIYRHDPTPWHKVLLGWMAAMYICAAFTPVILWLGRRWPIDQPGWGRRVGLHFVFASVFSVAENAIEIPVLIALGVLPPTGEGYATTFLMFLVNGFHGNIIRYWIVLGLQVAIRAFQLRMHSSELSAQLTRAQLNALKMQLQPHFLFNTLGAIMVLVRKGEARQAESMLARLSDLLRSALESVEAQEAPLWRELEFLRLYLSIEEVRFQDRLRVRIASDPTLSDALLPHMALQPIVENAVRHGLARSEKAVLIEVEARREANDMVLTVQDDGPGNLPLGFEGKGIGLTNTRNRLQRLYGEKFSLSIQNRTPHGVLVKMVLPFHVDGV